MSASTGNVLGWIFMSYRREETAYAAGWLFDRLASHFGRDKVFRDVDAIELGDDFVEVITAAVGSCDVLLALIGDRWLTITDQEGRRRLDNPDDFVRLEIEAALTRNVRVIPILVEGARMPRADELPASLDKLVRRQALELSPSRFEFDTRRLLRVLDRTLAEAQEQARQEAERAAHRRQMEQLQDQIRQRAAAQDWDAVLTVDDQLAALDPAAADPDGLASTAREQIARRQEAEEAAAAHRRQMEQLQDQIRQRAAAQDWDAVLTVDDQLAALDPAAADPDGLASTAREQIARRQEAEEAAAAHRRQMEQLQDQIRQRAAAQDWDAVLTVDDQLAALDPAAADPDGLASTAREQIARRQEAERAAHRRQIEQLQDQIRQRAAAQDWDAVLTVDDQLAALDPAAADPDGLASTAREQIARRQEAERAAHRRQIEQLQDQIRQRAAAQDWDAVLTVDDQLAALDPAAADPDGLASTAREQIARRQEAERAAAPLGPVRSILSVLWALLPTLTIGLLTPILAPIPFAHAAVRLRDQGLWLITAAYGLGSLTIWIMWIVAINEKWDAASLTFYFILLVLGVVATIHAFKLRRRVFAPPSPPTVATPSSSRAVS